jgi:hypothetical protein
MQCAGSGEDWRALVRGGCGGKMFMMKRGGEEREVPVPVALLFAAFSTVVSSHPFRPCPIHRGRLTTYFTTIFMRSCHDQPD